jgi:hypothetical protein
MIPARTLAPACFAVLLITSAAAAQDSGAAKPPSGGASLVVGAGPAFPLDDFTDMARTGWQASLRAEFRLGALFAPYLGASYANFPRKGDEATETLSMIAPEAGLVLRTRGRVGIAPFFRAGAFLPQFSSAGETSGAGVGFAGAVGVEAAVGDRLTVSAVGDGHFARGRLKTGPFGPIPPRPSWMGVGLEARYSFR